MGKREKGFDSSNARPILIYFYSQLNPHNNLS